MEDLAIENDFIGIVLAETPLIDVRAPVEFAAGAFPGAVSLPILDDRDRHLVGKCYRQNGQVAAFSLAERRVSGEVREKRITAWADFHLDHPDSLFYCFRGGMRSTVAQRWLQQHTGRLLPRLAGGYKNFRRFLMEALDPDRIAAVPVILGGRTGAGKTKLLQGLANSIDLEGLAHHRGSAFGAYLTPQPSQIDFENRLAYAVIQHGSSGFATMVIEDEGSHIGARYIPHRLAAHFKRDSLVLLESDIEERIQRTCAEYVTAAQGQYRQVYGPEASLNLWLKEMTQRLERIRKRLGGERHARVLAVLEAAFAKQQETGDIADHRAWIEILLLEYYDPMYDYQIAKGGRRVAFCGSYEEVMAYLLELEADTADSRK